MDVSPDVLYRFLLPVHHKPDQVLASKTEVERIVPGSGGHRKGYEDVFTYVVKPVPGQNSFQWQYQDPENANRLTNWGTGLVLTVSNTPLLDTLDPFLAPLLPLA